MGSKPKIAPAEWKNNVRFVLVSPRESGNVGASARAIKNMGFARLGLVDAPEPLGDEAQWFARNAHDVLDSAERFATIGDALSGAALIVGTTRRKGRKRGVFLPIETASRRIREVAETQGVVVLFGGERKGLSNEQAEQCNLLFSIPVGSAEQPSLNLAQAVLIAAYEISRAGQTAPERPTQGAEALVLATHDELSEFYDRIASLLGTLGYTQRGDSDIERKIMRLIRQFIGRAGMAEWELKMLLGLCSRVDDRLSKQ